MEQRALNKLRDKLRRDYSLLVEGTYREVERDGYTQRVRLAGLIAQLRESVSNSFERKRVIRSKGAVPLVISAQAFDLMADIERVTSEWAKTGSAEARITETVLGLCAQSIEAIPQMRYIIRYLDSWVRLINELFDPPKRFTLSAPCPDCGEATVRLFHTDDDEYVVAPALQISKRGEQLVCECNACGAEWPDTHFLLLAEVLGCDRVVCPDPSGLEVILDRRQQRLSH